MKLKDIAQQFNTSISTVSRALDDSPRISLKLRREIQAYAEEHHFARNPIGEMLRKGKSPTQQTIGVIIPQIAHYYFSTILSGIEQYATKHGYQVVVAQSNERYDDEARICHQFIKNHVAGVIVSQAKDTRRYDHFTALTDAGIPLVFYDRICTGMNTSRVVVDDYQGAFKAVEHLIATGCRRIAYYGTAEALEISKNRLNGYKDALLSHGLPIDNALIITCDNREAAERRTPPLLEANAQTPIDAFFCVNDDTAIGVLHSVKRQGMRVPDEVSICGFTNGVRAIASDPMLTTVEQHGISVGEQAAEVIIGKIEGTIASDKVERRIVRTKLIVRGTTR